MSTATSNEFLAALFFSDVEWSWSNGFVMYWGSYSKLFPNKVKKLIISNHHTDVIGVNANASFHKAPICKSNVSQDTILPTTIPHTQRSHFLATI